MEIRSLIEAVLGVLIGLALYPAVQGATDAAIDNATAGSVVASLLPLVPTIYIIVVIVGAAAYVYSKK